MTDTAITGGTEKTDVNGEEVLPIVDLRESAAASQNKKMTIDTLFASILTFENEILIFEGEILYME